MEAPNLHGTNGSRQNSSQTNPDPSEISVHSWFDLQSYVDVHFKLTIVIMLFVGLGNGGD